MAREHPPLQRTFQDVSARDGALDVFDARLGSIEGHGGHVDSYPLDSRRRSQTLLPQALHGTQQAGSLRRTNAFERAFEGATAAGPHLYDGNE